MGAYHTIDLELNRKFTLMKEEWDSIDLGRIEMATDPTQVFFYALFLYFNKYKLSNFRQLMWQR
jgi:stalled ribosome rescue protein Dom34